MKKEIYIIRHGETEFNQLGIVQGKGINSSLNETGKMQGLKFYNAYKNTGFEKIYVSTLKRTLETVSDFQELNIPTEKNPALDEISWGIHEGKSNGETFKYFYHTLHLWKQGQVNIKIEGGESPLEVQERQLIFIDELKASPENKILICSHGRAMRILLCSMLNKPLQDMDTFPHHNTSLYKLIFEDGVFTVELFNDLSHLNGK